MYPHLFRSEIMERDGSFSEDDKSVNEIWKYVENCRHEARDNNEGVSQILSSGSPELPSHLFEAQTPPHFLSSPELHTPYLDAQPNYKLHSSSLELPNHLFEPQTPPTLEQHSPWTPYNFSQSILPLENRTIGVQREHLNFLSREGTDIFPSSELLSGDLGCSTPKKLIDRSRLAPNKALFQPSNLSLYNSSETQTLFSSNHEDFQSNILEYLNHVTHNPLTTNGRCSVNSIRTDLMGDPAPDIPMQSTLYSPYTMPYHEAVLVNSLLTNSKNHDIQCTNQSRIFQEKLSKAENTIASLNKALQEKRLDNDKLSGQNTDIKKQLQSRETDLQSNIQALDKLQEDVSSLQKENQGLKLLYEQEKKKSAFDSQQISIQQSKFNAERNALRAENLHLEQENTNLIKAYQELEEEKGLLLDHNASLVMANKTLKTTTENLSSEFQTLQEHLNCSNILNAVISLEQEMEQMKKDQEFLEKENGDLLNQIETISEQNKSNAQNMIDDTSYQATQEQVKKLDEELELLNTHHNSLQQQKRALTSKTKGLETSFEKLSDAYNQLLTQNANLESKKNELKEKNTAINIEINKLIASKSDLLKRKRALEIEVGNLESNVGSISKSLGKAQSSRRRPGIPNFNPPQTQSNSRATSRGSSRPQSSLSNGAQKTRHQSHASEGSFAIEDSFSLNLNMPSLSFQEPGISEHTSEEVDVVIRKLERSKLRVKELECLVQALYTTVDTLTKNVELKSNCNSVEQSPVRPQTKLINDHDVSQVIQDTHVAIGKIDDLCTLLQHNTGEFDRLIQAEDRAYRLKEQNDQLQSDLESVKLELYRAKGTPVFATLDPGTDRNALQESEKKINEVVNENKSLRQQLNNALERLHAFKNTPPVPYQSESNYDTRFDKVERSLESSQGKQKELALQNHKLSQDREEINFLLEEANQENNLLKEELGIMRTDLENCQFFYEQTRNKLHDEQVIKHKYLQELQLLENRHQALRQQYDLVASQRAAYPSPKSAASSLPHSRSNSGIIEFSHRPISPFKSLDEVSKVFCQIKAVHHNLRCLLRDLQNGIRLDVFQSRFMDSINELKELDLQILHLLNRGTMISQTNSFLSVQSAGEQSPLSGHSRASSVAEINQSNFLFNRDTCIEPELKGYHVYKRPYKDICIKYRNENLQLRARLERESAFKADLIFQKHYLVLMVGGLEAGEDYALSFISSMGVNLNHDTKYSVPQAPTCTITPNCYLSPAVRRTVSNYTAASSLNRCKLRRCVWAIVAIIRAQALALAWKATCDKYRIISTVN